MCVFTKFMHFKLFICGAQLNWDGQEGFFGALQMHRAELHFDCLECKHKELVCVRVLVCVM